jgi:hypothetical protein
MNKLPVKKEPFSSTVFAMFTSLIRFPRTLDAQLMLSSSLLLTSMWPTLEIPEVSFADREKLSIFLLTINLKAKKKKNASRMQEEWSTWAE